MKKTLKFILSFFSILIILLVSVPIVVSMLLQISVIQNFAVDQVTKLLSEKAKTTMSVSHIDIEFFNRVVIDDVFIADHRGDTMINIKKLKVDIKGINFLNGKISLGAVNVIEGQCRLWQDAELVMNVQRVFDNFQPEVPPTDQPNFRMSVSEVNLINFDFSMKLYDAKPQKYGINFQDLAFSKVNFQARQFEIYNYDIWLAIENLRFKDKSGFYLQHLSSPRCGVNDSGMRFEKLRIETAKSLLQMGHAYLLYDSWYAYNNFVEEVTLDVDIKPSKFSYHTLSYFIGQPANIPTTIQIEGRVRGPIPNLNGYLSSIHFGNTDLGVNFSVVGLPDITKTNFNLQLDHLITNATDIEKIYGQVSGGNSLGTVKDILDRAGEIKVQGTFKGLLNDYQSKASVVVEQGELEAELNVKSKLSEMMQMQGRLVSEEFNIGSLLAAPVLGGVSVNANVDMLIAKDQEPTLTAKGKVGHLYLAGYDFKDIALNGKFVGKAYQGEVDCNDPNLIFHTEGKFDLNGKEPVYDFSMDLKRANFVALGVNKRDSVSELSARFSAAGVGNNIDNINGVTKIEHIVYVNHIDTVRAGDIKILSRNDKSIKQMIMTSDFVDIDVMGTNSYSQILTYLAQSAQRYIPSIPDAQQIIEQEYDNKKGHDKKKPIKEQLSPKFNDGSYTIEVNVKQANNVASIFVPGLEIARGSRLSFMFDPMADKFRLDMKSDYIGQLENQLHNIVLTGRNSLDSVMFKLTAKELDAVGLKMPNFEVRGRLMDNKINLGVRFNNKETRTGLDVRTVTSIYRTETDMPQIKIQFRPTSFEVDGDPWGLDSSYVLIDSTGFTVNKFRLHADNEHISLDGKVGKMLTDSLTLDLKDIDISSASVLVSSLGYNLSGHICGSATGVSLLRDMHFDAILNIHEFKVNDYPLGDPCFMANWNVQRKRVEMGISKNGLYKVGDELPITGYLDLANNRYGAKVRFPKFDMVLLEPLLQGILTKTAGEADVDLSLTGVGDKPSLNGTIDIKNYKLQVDYTKAEYTIKPGRVDVKNNNFKAIGLSLTDNLKGTGKADLQLNSNYFKNLSFGVNIRFNDLLALNTTEADNSVFFGRAFGSGEFDITGNERKTSMVINAQTALESEFNLPFNGISTIEDASFITFVEPNFESQDTTKRSRQYSNMSGQRKSVNELDIKINMNVLQNTKARISMVNDYISNDIMGVGNGNLRLHINPLQDIFTMNGTFEIVRGSYQFQMRSIIIDKQLSIKPGGTVVWSGDPADPMVNIDAVYKVKTSLDPLTGGNSMSQFGTNVNLDCGVNLVGKLFTPTLNLSITAPSADPETQNFLRNYLNTQELISNQFFSLLLFRTFTPDMSTASVGSMGTSLASAAGFEFLANQLSNLISNEKFRFKVGYRPRSENTSDEFSANFETDIIPNKLSIEVGGNYNTGNNKTYSQRAPFTGDAYITYVLNKAGTLKLKGFTRVIERFDETQGLQDSGIGLYMRQDFQTFEELREKVRAKRAEDAKRRELKRAERKAKKM